MANPKIKQISVNGQVYDITGTPDVIDGNLTVNGMLTVYPEAAEDSDVVVKFGTYEFTKAMIESLASLATGSYTDVSVVGQ